MKTFLSLMLFFCPSLNSWATNQIKDVSWSFVSIKRSSITIDPKELIDVAVIRDTNGLAAFNAKYGVEVAASENLFTSNIIVVVFMDIRIEIDGVGKSRRDEFYVSLNDTGEDIKMVEPPPGKVYVSLQSISLPKEIADGRIFIRRQKPATRTDFKKE